MDHCCCCSRSSITVGSKMEWVFKCRTILFVPLEARYSFFFPAWAQYLQGQTLAPSLFNNTTYISSVPFMCLYTQAVCFLFVFVDVACGVDALETSRFDSLTRSWNWELSRVERVVELEEVGRDGAADSRLDSLSIRVGEAFQPNGRRDWVVGPF
jgi:hypothetical protein